MDTTRRRSKVEIRLHFVWATWRRAPLLTPDWISPIYGSIIGEADRLHVTILAIGGVADHVHLAVAMPATVTPANLMQQIKGVSSTFARQTLTNGEFFGWQDNYAVFSFDPADTPDVIHYIETQKEHHAQGNLRHDWEDTDEPG